MALARAVRDLNVHSIKYVTTCIVLTATSTKLLS